MKQNSCKAMNEFDAQRKKDINTLIVPPPTEYDRGYEDGYYDACKLLGTLISNITRIAKRGDTDGDDVKGA